MSNCVLFKLAELIYMQMQQAIRYGNAPTSKFDIEFLQAPSVPTTYNTVAWSNGIETFSICYVVLPVKLLLLPPPAIRL